MQYGIVTLDISSTSVTSIGFGTVCVTGGTRGCGYEAARQLSSRFSRVIIASRNETSAKVAVAQLAVDTGRPASAFSFVVLDLLSP